MRFALFGATGATGSAFLRQEFVKDIKASLKTTSTYFDQALLSTVVTMKYGPWCLYAAYYAVHTPCCSS